jgi:hypothetical protein
MRDSMRYMKEAVVTMIQNQMIIGSIMNVWIVKKYGWKINE